MTPRAKAPVEPSAERSVLRESDAIFDHLPLGAGGPGAALRRLREAAAKGRLAHALMFQGPRGSGKRYLGVRLAEWLSCETSGDGQAGPCLACASCERKERGADQGLWLVEPPFDEKRGSVKAEIPVELVRRVQESLTYRSSAAHRFIIVDPADRLSAVAQEALLKTLEEPPAGVTIVLVTSRPSALKPTVRSRCQVVRLGAPAADELAVALQALRGLDLERARLAAAVSRRDARRAAETEPEEVHEAWLAVARSLYEVLGSQGEMRARDVALAAVPRKGGGGDDADGDGVPRDGVLAWLDVVEDVLRRVLLAGCGLEAAHPGAEKAVTALAARLQPEGAAAALEALEEARADLALHCNTKVALTRLLLVLHRTRAA